MRSKNLGLMRFYAFKDYGEASITNFRICLASRTAAKVLKYIFFHPININITDTYEYIEHTTKLTVVSECVCLLCAQREDLRSEGVRNKQLLFAGCQR